MKNQDFRLKVTQIILNNTPIFDQFIRENPNILDFLPLKVVNNVNKFKTEYYSSFSSI